MAHFTTLSETVEPVVFFAEIPAPDKLADVAADRAHRPDMRRSCPAGGLCQRRVLAPDYRVTGNILKPGQGAWANYDFKPGDRIIFADDFSKDEVGDFPRRFEFKSGQIEIVEWNEGRWLRAAQGKFWIPLLETLPERYTVEFDLTGNGNAMLMTFDGKNESETVGMRVL